MILVLDASMALAWLCRRERASEADCADRAHSAFLEANVWVPPVWHLEVATDAARLPSPLALARQHGLSVYDACYLELTLRLGAVLATFDRHLAAAARKAGSVVFS